MTTSTASLPRLIVDLAAVAENYAALQANTAAEVAGVVKADAYGLGLIAVATTLYEAKCRTFFVSFAAEGVQLRNRLPSVTIFVLSPLLPRDQHLLCRYRLIPCLYDSDGVDRWIAATGSQSRPLGCGLHVEIGMHRLGMSVDELQALPAGGARRRRLNIVLLMSHLSCANDPNSRYNRTQRQRFAGICDRFHRVRASLSNSAGIFLGSSYHYDLVRPGIAIYGHDPHYHVHHCPRVRPVASLRATLAQIRHLRPGDSAGYGAVATTQSHRRIGVVLIGYADGLPWSAYPGSYPNPHRVFINGYFAPLFGAVSMDMITVDLSAVPATAVRVGDEAEIFGVHAPIENLAACAGTIPYEILCGTGHRVPRVYVRGGEAFGSDLRVQ